MSAGLYAFLKLFATDFLLAGVLILWLLRYCIEQQKEGRPLRYRSAPFFTGLALISLGLLLLWNQPIPFLIPLLSYPPLAPLTEKLRGVKLK